jgi:hypothetical protein
MKPTGLTAFCDGVAVATTPLGRRHRTKVEVRSLRDLTEAQIRVLRQLSQGPATAPELFSDYEHSEMSMFTTRGLAYCDEFTEAGEPIFKITLLGREILEAWIKKRKEDEHPGKGEEGGAQGPEGR